MTVRFTVGGDEQNARKLKRFAMNQLQMCKGQMEYQKLNQYRRIAPGPDGSTIECRSVYGQDFVEVYVPPVRPEAKPSEFIPSEALYGATIFSQTYCIVKDVIQNRYGGQKIDEYPPNTFGNSFYAKTGNFLHGCQQELLGQYVANRDLILRGTIADGSELSAVVSFSQEGARWSVEINIPGLAVEGESLISVPPGTPGSLSDQSKYPTSLWLEDSLNSNLKFPLITFDFSLSWEETEPGVLILYPTTSWSDFYNIDDLATVISFFSARFSSGSISFILSVISSINRSSNNFLFFSNAVVASWIISSRSSS